MIVEARGEKALHRRLRDFAARGQSARRQQARAWKAWRRPAPSTRSSTTARASSPAPTRILAACQRSHEAATIGQNDIVRQSRRMRRGDRCRRSNRGCRPTGCRREYDAIGFFLSGHPLDDYATGAEAPEASQILGGVFAAP